MSSPRPEPHPDPPTDLNERPLPTITLSGPWFRFHKSYRDPLHFGATGNNRFDAPAGEYIILYLGSDEHCGFIETFGQSTGISIISELELAKRRMSRLKATRPLQLVDLTGPGLAQIGADERLCAGDHSLAQRWALAIWQHPFKADGLYYRARHDPSRFCIALFERARDALQILGQADLLALDQKLLLADILETYAFDLLEEST